MAISGIPWHTCAAEGSFGVVTHGIIFSAVVSIIDALINIWKKQLK